MNAPTARFAVLAVLIGVASPAGAQPASLTPAAAPSASATGVDPSAARVLAPGIVRTTRGTVTLAGGKIIPFSAEAGLIAAPGEVANNAPSGGVADTGNGRPVAVMSYVAYFAHDADPAKRPILFLWDGGPGASTRGLLLSSFGPIRIDLPQPGQAPPAGPPPILPNSDTLLDVADLVFIDAPGTGFGHIQGRDAAKAFYGIDGDAAAFTHFIERFLVLHDRAGSPLFLFGHSYGTMRAPVVAHLLSDDGTPPLGIVAVSQWLNNDDNIDAARAHPGTDNAYVDALPSYAAIAWYHHRLHDQPAELAPFLARVGDFAVGDYATALLAGATLPAEKQHEVAAALESMTGIAASTWIQADLRIDGDAFRRLVLGDPARVVGRLDARYVGLVRDPLASTADGDPFGDAVEAISTAAGDRYERDVLGFGNMAGFSADAAVPGLDWDSYHSTDDRPWDSFFNVIPDLAAVMIAHPATRYLLVNGWYDLSTTMLGAVEDLRHLPIPASLRKNVQTMFVGTGHEPYIQDDVRHAMHDRIAEFIDAPTLAEGKPQP